MHIQINTDNHVEPSDRLLEHTRKSVEGALGRFSERITTVEVHLGDENSHKGGDADQRCTIEARLEGRKPAAVTHHAHVMEQAIDGAAKKLQRLIQSDLGRLEDHR